MNLGPLSIECPSECKCGAIYDAATWDECPACQIVSLTVRYTKLKLAAEEALELLRDDAPLHAKDALETALAAKL